MHFEVKQTERILPSDGPRPVSGKRNARYVVSNENKYSNTQSTRSHENTKALELVIRYFRCLRLLSLEVM